jgi:hypothetical protein
MVHESQLAQYVTDDGAFEQKCSCGVVVYKGYDFTACENAFRRHLRSV